MIRGLLSVNRVCMFLTVATIVAAWGASCGQTESAAPGGPAIVGQVEAIQNDPRLSPSEKAIAVERLERATVQDALSGTVTPQSH